jgi:hypothetical protein
VTCIAVLFQKRLREYTTDLSEVSRPSGACSKSVLHEHEARKVTTQWRQSVFVRVLHVITGAIIIVCFTRSDRYRTQRELVTIWERAHGISLRSLNPDARETAVRLGASFGLQTVHLTRPFQHQRFEHCSQFNFSQVF